MNPHYDLIVLGAGTAGLSCVLEAFKLDCKHIALIEKDNRFGGSCAQYACVPTKTLLEAAKLLKAIRNQSARYGIQVEEPTLNMQALARTVTAVINHGRDDVCEDSRLDCYHGIARFTGAHELTVNDEQVLTADKFIIATGSEPVIPKIAGLESTEFLTYIQASRLSELPESLIILGGGAVGVEFAQLFQLLGCQVTLLEHSDRLISQEEPELSKALQACLEADGVQVHLQSEVVHVGQNGSVKRVTTRSNRVFEASALLLAVGVQPTMRDLDLPKAQVDFNPKGIVINQFLQSVSNQDIYAVGDVAGPYRLTNIADYQATLAVRHALGKKLNPVDYRANGWAVYTSPTVARVGLTEEEARKHYPSILTLTAEPEDVSRYRISAETEGFIKLIVDTTTHCLVGGHILAENAEDMAHFLMLAIHCRIPIPQFQDLPFIYPSKAQLIQKAIEKYPSLQITEQMPLNMPTTSIWAI